MHKIGNIDPAMLNDRWMMTHLESKKSLSCEEVPEEYVTFGYAADGKDRRGYPMLVDRWTPLWLGLIRGAGTLVKAAAPMRVPECEAFGSAKGDGFSPKNLHRALHRWLSKNL